MKYDTKQKTYLGFLLDIEETMLSIDEIINELEKHCSSLGIKKKIKIPIRKQVETKDSNYAGWVIGFIVGTIVAIIKISFSISNNKSGNALSGAINFFGEFIFGAIIGAVVGLIAGLIANAIVKAKKDEDVQKMADIDYERELKCYNDALKQDQDRVDIENEQKSYIFEQISLLSKKKQSSLEISEKIYSYNLIDKKYWHNLSALSYFNQYYIKPIDNSSFDDAKSGYKRAYLDYENDLNHNLVVSDPKNIITASDYSIRKQRDLFRIMKNLYNTASAVSKEVINESYSRNKPVDKTAANLFIKEKEEMENLCCLIILSIFNKGEK